MNAVQNAEENNRWEKGANQDLPPLQTQQCGFRPGRPPGIERFYYPRLCVLK